MALKAEHKIFVKWMAKTGDHILSYQKAFPQADRKTAATNGGRLLKNAEIAEAIRQQAEKISKKAEKEAVEELKEEIKGDVLTAAQKRELLRQIANGEEINGKRPSFQDRLKAIEIDNKMAGDNAPDKLDHTTKGKALPKTLPLVQKIEVIHTNKAHVNPSTTDTTNGTPADGEPGSE